MRDLAELVEDRIPHIVAVYSDLGKALDDCYFESLEPHPERWEPVSGVITLVQQADSCIANGDTNDALLIYRLALRWGLHPKVQAELGYLFLQRAGVKILPLCEDDTEVGIHDWDPECWIHDQVKEAPLFPDGKCMAELALQAFGAAWAFYENSPYHEAATLGGLLALDGMRVAAETLDDVELLSAVCRAFRDWLDGRAADYSDVDEHASVFKSLEIRLARAEGSLKPSKVQRKKLSQQLGSQLACFWELPSEVQDRLVDAEFWRLILTEPEVDRSPVVQEYFRALEAMMRVRVGEALDRFLEMAGEEGKAFRCRALGEGRKFGALTLSEFRRLRRPRVIQESLWQQFWSQCGIEDAASYVNVLLERLEPIIPRYRHAAAHSGTIMKDEDVSRVRHIVVGAEGLLAELARLKTWRSASPGDSAKGQTDAQG